MKFLHYRGLIYQRTQRVVDLIRIERFSKSEVALQSPLNQQES
jgi:hypothetical protein